MSYTELEELKAAWSKKTIIPKISEEVLRDEYPALKQAWDNYQTLLKIARADYDK
jgi:hypothetical protein